MSEGGRGAPPADDHADAGCDDPVEVPLDALSPEALLAVIETFIGREGTDYGERERTLEEKVADVRRQLDRREARIVFDPESESVTILPMR